MSDEPTERDVEALADEEREALIAEIIAASDADVRLLVLLSGVTLDQFNEALPGIQRALAVRAVSALAERIAQARREGAAEAASSGYFRGYHDCRDGMQFRDPWRDPVPGAGI